MVRAGVGVDAGAVVSDTVNVDTLVETVREAVAREFEELKPYLVDRWR